MLYQLYIPSLFERHIYNLKDIKTKNTKTWIMYGIIIIGTLAPLARYWLAGLTLIHRDQTGQYAPLRWMISQALREGRLPLWNPYCATGMPYMADIMHGVLHPFSLLAALISPGNDLDLLVGAYILSAAIGAAVLARSMGASRSASVLAAFAYGLSGYTLSMTSNMVNLAGAGSVPWILAGLRYTACRQSAAAFAAGAFAVAAGAFSGDVQQLAVATLIGLTLALEGGKKRGFLLALSAVFTGVVIASVQLVPSWEFLHLSNRVLPLSADDVNQWDLAPWRILEFISPGFFTWPEDGWITAPVYMALGHPTQFHIPFAESVFLGAATILLAIAGIRSGRTGIVLALGAIVVLWFAMGSNLGARSLQNLVPVVSGFRYGEKFLPTFNMCIAMLAAFGADRIVRDVKLARSFLMATVVISGLLFVFWILMVINGIHIGPLEGSDIATHLTRGIPHAFVAALALAVCCWLASKGKSNQALFGMIAIVWCAAVWVSQFDLRPGHPEARISVAPPAITSPPPGPRVLNVRGALPHSPPPGWDSIDQLNFDVLSSLGANTNARHRIDNMDVDTGQLPLRYYLLRGTFGRDFPAASRRYGVTHMIFPPPKSDNGKQIVTTATAGGSFVEVDARNGMQIWKVPHRDWAGFPSHVILSGDRDSALKYLLHGDIVDWNTVTIESKESFSVSPGRVLSLSRGVERIEIIAESTGDSTLVVNDAYWPGWQARIDRTETEIFPADALVRAVKWPAGRHTLEMVYDPPEVKKGKWLTLIGLILLVGVSISLNRTAANPKSEK
jgi:hypothetical protein